MKLLFIFLILKMGFSEFNILAEPPVVQENKVSSSTVVTDVKNGTAQIYQIEGSILNSISQCQQGASAYQAGGLTCSNSPNVKIFIEGCISQIRAGLQGFYSQNEAQINKCNKLGRINNVSCTAATYMPYVNMLTGMIAGSSSGSMYDKCKKAATLQTGMSTISAAFAGSCYFTKNSCVKSCEEIASVAASSEAKLSSALGGLQSLIDPGCGIDLTAINGELKAANQKTIGSVQGYAESCEANELNIMSAVLSAGQLIQGIAQSQSCQKELAQGECTKPEAVNNPSCTAAYCSNQANRAAPQCVAMFGECYSANAAANPRCACLQNPMQQSCLNLPTVDTNTPLRNTASNNTTDGFNFDEDDIYGDQGDNLGLGDPNARAPGVVGGGQQGGGSGSGQGSALGGGPGGGGSGAQKGVYDTNVTGGTSAGGGGAGSGGGGIAGYGGGAGYGNGSSGVGSGMNFGKSSLDLKKYLPGGQLAKQRDEQNTGITSANGLSNFQKVNRSHNKNRGALVNP